RLALSQGILRSLSFDKLADLAADREERVQQIRIGRALLGCKEFDNADGFACHTNGKATGARQVCRHGIAPAREIRIIFKVFDPGRLAGGPDASRQAGMRGEMHGSRVFGKALQFFRISMPNVLTAQSEYGWINAPDEGNIPGQAFAASFQNGS